MNRLFILLAGILFAMNGIAQNFNLVWQNENQIKVSHELDVQAAEYVTIGADNYISFQKSYDVVTMKEGAPAVPFFAESIIVPSQGKVSFNTTHDGYTEYDNVLVAPSKGSLKRNINPADVPFNFGTEYETDAFYPASIATLSEPFIFRSTRGVNVAIQPYQYNPVTKTLRVYKNVNVSVEIDKNEIGYNELEYDLKPNDVFTKEYSNLYLNANTVLGLYSVVDEDGEMLIIADDDFLDEIESFVDWKNQKGIRTVPVGTSEAGTTDTDIKSYIEDYLSANPDLKYVLLVGDHDEVPSHTYGMAGAEQLWSDSYYGQMTSDFYPELFVGRFSSSSAADIETMVERTLEYEKNPAEGDWMTKTIGLASNEGGGIGDDDEADWEHARNIRAKFLDYGYTEVFEFYDGSHGGEDAGGNPNSTMITAAVEGGVSLFNYTGHGAEDVCVTGNFSSSNVNAATNNGYYPFVISVACNNGTFTSGTCISEAWLSATNAGTPTGAIAACGSSILMAWAEPMQTQDEMAEIITEAYADNYKVTLGGLFYNSQMSVLENYSSSSTAKEVMQTWVMFGDPSCVYRNKETLTLDVTHVASIVEGTSEIVANCDVEGATIAISKDSELLGKAIVSGGVATITIPEAVEGDTLKVVGTKQNYAPYEGSIEVINDVSGIDNKSSAMLTIYPNPATEMFTVYFGSEKPSNIEVLDLSGGIVYRTSIVNGQGKQTISTVDFASGIYFVKVTSGNSFETHKVVIR